MSNTTFTAESGKQEIKMSRIFNAPIDLVWTVWTDPKQIPNWWGPEYLTTEVKTMEVRTGGQWNIVQRDPQGNEHGFRGVYHTIDPKKYIVDTFEYAGVPGHVILESATFEDLGGKTKVTTLSVFQSIEDRDGMMASGMESGALESWNRFAELVEQQ